MGLIQWLFRAKDRALVENPNDSQLVGELVKAAGAGDEQRIEKLLRRGINPNNCDQYGQSALTEAILKGRPKVVQILLKEGADPNLAAIDTVGWSPIWWAAGEGPDVSPMLEQQAARLGVALARPDLHWREILLMLLAGGADPNWQVEKDGDFKGWTPLMRAVLDESAAVAKELLKAGANPDIRNADGQSALLQATNKGNAELVYLLVSNGANPNLQGNDGWTPLMVAAAIGNSVIVQLLLKHNADVSARNDQGKTARDIAQNAGDEKIALQLFVAGSP